MSRFDEIRSAIEEIQRDNEIRDKIQKRDARTKALWLGIACIEAYNDDTEESNIAIDILKEIIEEKI